MLEPALSNRHYLRRVAGMAVGKVIIDQAERLHCCVHRRRANKLEATLEQLF